MSLLRFAIERTRRGCTPAPAITAPIPELQAGDPDKGLSDNRDRYIEQSRNTVNGQVADLPKRSSTC